MENPLLITGIAATLRAFESMPSNNLPVKNPIFFYAFLHLKLNLFLKIMMLITNEVSA
jgi:hypothetical protein